MSQLLGKNFSISREPSTLEPHTKLMRQYSVRFAAKLWLWIGVFYPNGKVLRVKQRITANLGIELLKNLTLASGRQ